MIHSSCTIVGKEERFLQVTLGMLPPQVGLPPPSPTINASVNQFVPTAAANLVISKVGQRSTSTYGAKMLLVGLDGRRVAGTTTAAVVFGAMVAAIPPFCDMDDG
jgi:hypothetical protein